MPFGAPPPRMSTIQCPLWKKCSVRSTVVARRAFDRGLSKTRYDVGTFPWTAPPAKLSFQLLPTCTAVSALGPSLSHHAATAGGRAPSGTPIDAQYARALWLAAGDAREPSAYAREPTTSAIATTKIRVRTTRRLLPRTAPPISSCACQRSRNAQRHDIERTERHADDRTDRGGEHRSKAAVQKDDEQRARELERRACGRRGRRGHQLHRDERREEQHPIHRAPAQRAPEERSHGAWVVREPVEPSERLARAEERRRPERAEERDPAHCAQTREK